MGQSVVAGTAIGCEVSCSTMHWEQMHSYHVHNATFCDFRRFLERKHSKIEITFTRVPLFGSKK